MWKSRHPRRLPEITRPTTPLLHRQTMTLQPNPDHHLPIQSSPLDTCTIRIHLIWKCIVKNQRSKSVSLERGTDIQRHHISLFSYFAKPGFPRAKVNGPTTQLHVVHWLTPEWPTSRVSLPSVPSTSVVTHQ